MFESYIVLLTEHTGGVMDHPTLTLSSICYPLVCLHFIDRSLHGVSDFVYMDVGEAQREFFGKNLERRRGSGISRIGPVMRRLLRKFESVGRPIDNIHAYTGSGGPNMAWRGGKLYRRFENIPIPGRVESEIKHDDGRSTVVYKNDMRFRQIRVDAPLEEFVGWEQMNEEHRELFSRMRNLFAGKLP